MKPSQVRQRILEGPVSLRRQLDELLWGRGGVLRGRDPRGNLMLDADLLRDDLVGVDVETG